MGFKIFSLALLGLIAVGNCQSASQKLVSKAVSELEVRYLEVLSASAQYTSEAIKGSYNFTKSLSERIQFLGNMNFAVQEAAELMEADTTNCTVQENAITTEIDLSLILSCITPNVFNDALSALNTIVSYAATTIEQCIPAEDPEECVSNKIDNYVSQMDSVSNTILEKIKKATITTKHCMAVANSNNMEILYKAQIALEACLFEK